MCVDENATKSRFHRAVPRILRYSLMHETQINDSKERVREGVICEFAH